MIRTCGPRFSGTRFGAEMFLSENRVSADTGATTRGLHIAELRIKTGRGYLDHSAEEQWLRAAVGA